MEGFLKAVIDGGTAYGQESPDTKLCSPSITIALIVLFMYCLLQLETRANMSHLSSAVCHGDVI
jgi:hypothetical protein